MSNDKLIKVSQAKQHWNFDEILKPAIDRIDKIEHDLAILKAHQDALEANLEIAYKLLTKYELKLKDLQTRLSNML